MLHNDWKVATSCCALKLGWIEKLKAFVKCQTQLSECKRWRKWLNNVFVFALHAFNNLFLSAFYIGVVSSQSICSILLDVL